METITLAAAIRMVTRATATLEPATLELPTPHRATLDRATPATAIAVMGTPGMATRTTPATPARRMRQLMVRTPITAPKRCSH